MQNPKLSAILRSHEKDSLVHSGSGTDPRGSLRDSPCERAEASVPTLGLSGEVEFAGCGDLPLLEQGAAGIATVGASLDSHPLGMEHPALAQLRCDDCAFREGTQANRTATTVLKAQLCAEIPEEFHCHRREGLCAGWAELANKLSREGFHANQQEWQRKLKSELVEIINRGERGELSDVSQAIMDAVMQVEP